MKKQRPVYASCLSLGMIAVLLFGCAGAPTPPNCAEPDVFCIGLVTLDGKIDDKALNQLAWKAVEQAERKLNAYVNYIETVDSRDYEKNITTFAIAGYDLIISVGYAQRKATIDAAAKYPGINFIGVDQPLEPDKSLPKNLTGLSFPEDQAGFLAGALAAQMTRTGKIGAVCGPDTFPPAWRYCEGFKAGANYITSPPATPPGETPTEGAPVEETPTTPVEPGQEEAPATEAPVTPIPPVEVTVIYHNELGFSDSLADPKWDAETADTLINIGVDIVFGADSYGENGAVSAAAKRSIYAIGVGTDQYLTLPDAQDVLLSSAIKQVTPGLLDLIKAARDGILPPGNFIGSVGYAPYHRLDGLMSAVVKARMAEIQAGLANGSIETGVPPVKP